MKNSLKHAKLVLLVGLICLISYGALQTNCEFTKLIVGKTLVTTTVVKPLGIKAAITKASIRWNRRPTPAMTVVAKPVVVAKYPAPVWAKPVFMKPVAIYKPLVWHPAPMQVWPTPSIEPIEQEVHETKLPAENEGVKGGVKSHETEKEK